MGYNGLLGDFDRKIYWLILTKISKKISKIHGKNFVEKSESGAIMLFIR